MREQEANLDKNILLRKVDKTLYVINVNLSEDAKQSAEDILGELVLQKGKKKYMKITMK